MNPDEKKLLDEAVTLSRENNILLRKMYRHAMWGRGLKALYWFIIIGIAIGSFYFLQPYLDTLKDVYGDVQNMQNEFKNFF